MKRSKPKNSFEFQPEHIDPTTLTALTILRWQLRSDANP